MLTPEQASTQIKEILKRLRTDIQQVTTSTSCGVQFTQGSKVIVIPPVSQKISKTTSLF